MFHQQDFCAVLGETHICADKMRGFGADMDRVLLTMWEIHCAGEGPRTFEV